MKKNYFNLKTVLATLLLFFVFDGLYAQINYYDVLPNNGGTSGNARAPQGSRRYARSIYLITSAEMTASGMVNGDVINSIAFNYLTGGDVSATGNLTVYLENTADATNLKSATWATAITGMTTASNASLTIPTTAGSLFIPFSGGSTFTYTGGAVYVAFDYQNAAGAIATTNATVLCNTALVNGLKGQQSQTAAPTTTVSSSFRPETKLGKASTCSWPLDGTYDPSTSTLNSSGIRWTSPDGGSSFQVEYGPYGFIQGAGTQVLSSTTTPTISSLSASTVYDYFVRKDCGSGTFSGWRGPFSFATIFAPTTPTYNTGFEHDQLEFVGWRNATFTAVSGDWSIGNYGAGPLVQEGTHSVASVTPAAAAANNYLFTRGLNLTAGSNVTISFYLSNFVNGTTNTGNYELRVGSGLTTASQTTIVGSESGISAAAFTLKTHNFVPPTTGVYYFSIVNTSPANTVGTHALIVDNFTVSEVLSANSFLNANVKVYPNPVNNILNIETNNQFEVLNIEIMDLNGRLIKKANKVNSINVSDILSGIYMVSIETNNGKSIQKFVKE